MEREVFYKRIHLEAFDQDSTENMDGKFPRNIKVAALNLTSLFEFAVDGSTKPKGIDGNLLEILSQALSFEYQVTSPKDGEYGQLTSDGNWTGIIGMVSKSEADFGMSTVFISHPRQQFVDFSIPYILTDTTFATQHPDTLPTLYTYIYAFDIYTWMGIAALLFLMPLVIRLISKKSSYVDTLMAVFGHLLKTSVPTKVFDGKPVTAVIWHFSAYVLAIGYAASISSFLFAPLHNPPIRTFKDLPEAISRDDDFKVKALSGAKRDPGMIASQSEHLKSVAESIIRNNWFLKPNFDFREEIFSSKMAIIATRFVLDLNLGSPPSAFISDDRTFTRLIGIAIRKNFCCKEKLNFALTRIVEAGIIEKLYRDEAWRYTRGHYNQKQSRLDISSHNEVLTLSLKDLSGAFFVLIGGFGLAFIAILIEIVYYKWR